MGKTKNDKDKKVQIGYIPEKVIFPPGIKVIFYLSLILRSHFSNKSDMITEIKRWSKILEKDHLFKAKTNRLSSGQEKNVLLLQAMCAKANFIVMDEPASNLDHDALYDFLTLCTKLVKDQKLLSWFDRILWMKYNTS